MLFKIKSNLTTRRTSTDYLDKEVNKNFKKFMKNITKILTKYGILSALQNLMVSKVCGSETTLMSMRKSLAVLAIVLLNSAIVLAGQNEHSEESRVVSIEPGPEDNFSKAVFYLRVPEKVTKPRYILVLLPGINADGSGLLKHKKWQQFAEENPGGDARLYFREKGQA